MTNRILFLAALAAFALPACKKSEKKATPVETPADPAPAAADPAPAAADPAPTAADPAPAAADPAPAAADPAPAAAPADPALMKAAEAYVRKNAAKNAEYTVTVDAVEGDFARLKVTPKVPDDGAIVFMKRKGKTWTGVDMGTSIPCEDLEKLGFPPAVSKGCD